MKRPKRRPISMLLIRSRRNSEGLLRRGLVWKPAERVWVDGPSLFGRVYVHVPFAYENGEDHGMEFRVYPRRRIENRVVGVMLHDGEWYWMVRS